MTGRTQDVEGASRDGPVAGPDWPVRPFVTLGLALLLALCLGGGIWAFSARLSAAVVLPGQVAASDRHIPIQHPTGGRVAAVFVSEGAAIAADAPILRLDDPDTEGAVAVARTQWADWRARQARLEAERDGTDGIRFPADLARLAETDTGIADLIAGQTALFHARRRTMETEAAQLGHRITQIDAQLDGLGALEAAYAEQSVLLAAELARHEAALAEGLGRRDPVDALRREAAGLRGMRADLAARRAGTRERRHEVAIALVQLETARREAAIAELREVRQREQEAAERLAALLRRLEDLTLRAPEAGTILGLSSVSRGGVLRPAEPVAHIVPRGSPMVVALRIPPPRIAEVHAGQAVDLRFTAFDQRDPPAARGEVILVSADVIAPPDGGPPHYSAEVSFDLGSLPPDIAARIVQGMPATAFLQTGSRRPIDYLLAPLVRYFDRALRET